MRKIVSMALVIIMLVSVCPTAFAAEPNTTVRYYFNIGKYDIQSDIELMFNAEYGESLVNWDGLFEGDSPMTLKTGKYPNDRFILQLDLIGRIQFRPDTDYYLAKSKQAQESGKSFFDLNFNEQAAGNPFVYAYIPLMPAPIEKDIQFHNGSFDFTFNDFNLTPEQMDLLSTSATEQGPLAPSYDNVSINNYAVRLQVVKTGTKEPVSDAILLDKLDFGAEEKRAEYEAELDSIKMSFRDKNGNITPLSRDMEKPAVIASLAGSFEIESSLKVANDAAITFVPRINGVEDYEQCVQIYIKVNDGNATGNSSQFRTSQGIPLSYEQIKTQENIINTMYGEMIITFDFRRPDEYGSDNRVMYCFYVAMTAQDEDTNQQPGKTALFSDLSTDHWAFADIAALVAKGVLDGYPEGHFAPGASVKRSEFAKIMVMSLKLPLLPDIELPADWSRYSTPLTPRQALYSLEKTAWYYKYVISAADYLSSKEIIDGEITYYSFEPEIPATRVDIAVALVKSLNLQDEVSQADITAFSDYADIPAELRNYIALANQYGIVNGYPDGSFLPNNPITRAEAAAMLMRVLNNSTIGNRVTDKAADKETKDAGAGDADSSKTNDDKEKEGKTDNDKEDKALTKDNETDNIDSELVGC